MTHKLSEFADYKPNFPFEIDSEDFTIKIGTKPADMQKAQELRHKIFLEEGLGRTHETGLDFDEYDMFADHLMIIDKKSNDAVGTYRLINSRFAPKFYSQGEFTMDAFLKSEGIKLEMGRACTHMDFRNGRTMDLLWEGLSRYIIMTGTRFLFGCSSIKTTEPAIMFSMLKALHENEQLKFDFGIHPVPDFQWPLAQQLFEKSEAMPRYTKELPPLLRSYLNANSNVYGLPAYDKDFLCFDLLTILDLKNLNKKFQARYFPEDWKVGVPYKF